MILCAGEALIDMIPRQTAEGENAFVPLAGGSVFNTAVALGRLGAPVGMACGLSTDLFGDLLSDTLKASGVDPSAARRVDRPTTLAFVTLVDGQARYAFFDENTAGRMVTAEDLPQDLAGYEAVFVGGISLAVEPCASAFSALALRASGQALVMVDPNIRPGFISDEAAFRARMDQLIDAADIVKVSDEDLRWLAQDNTRPLIEIAQELQARGPALVCVTEGAKGVLAVRTSGALAVGTQKVTVIDTVGAGDTFNAGLLAGLQRRGALSRSALERLPENELTEVLSLGNRAAAITVSRAGANPPTAAELGLT